MQLLTSWTLHISNSHEAICTDNQDYTQVWWKKLKTHVIVSKITDLNE